MGYNKLSNIMIRVMESYDFAITLYVTDWLQVTNRRNKKSEKSEDLPDLIARNAKYDFTKPEDNASCFPSILKELVYFSGIGRDRHIPSVLSGLLDTCLRKECI